MITAIMAAIVLKTLHYHLISRVRRKNAYYVNFRTQPITGCIYAPSVDYYDLRFGSVGITDGSY